MPEQSGRKPNNKVLVVGSFVMDFIVHTSKFPERGETVLGDSFSMAPGGKGANQAMQMALLGLDVDMLGKVGSDVNGDILVSTIKNAGVNVNQVLRNGSFSAIGNVQVETDYQGNTENRIIVVSGANFEITDTDIDHLDKQISQYQAVVLQHEIPLFINKRICAMAKRHGVKVILNPAPSYALEEEDYRNIDYLLPNEHELLDLVGETGDERSDFSIESIVRRARILVTRGCPNIIVTLGSRGACWVTAEDYIYENAVQNVVSLDPTAAGDSFIAAFTYAMLSSFSARQSIVFSNYVGALTVSKKGAQTSLSTLKEVQEFIKNYTQEGT